MNRAAPASPWQPAPSGPQAEAGVVHVWRTRLAAPEAAECAWLAPEERARAERFHFPELRERYLSGRAFVRKVLGRYLQAEPGAIRFATGEHGKPRLAEERSPLEFNLSHSSDLLLLAVTRARAVGVDVEQVRPGRACAEIAARYFPPAAAREIQALEGDRQVVRFYEVWTATEARLKADGCGIAGLAQARAAERWPARNFLAAEGFAAAVAMEGDDFHLECWTWPN